jgi:hypothetical protein
MLDRVRLIHHYTFERFRFTKFDDDSEMFLHDIDLCLRLMISLE